MERGRTMKKREGTMEPRRQFRRGGLAVCGLLLALACGGNAPGPAQVVVNNTVHVTISDGPDAGKPPATIDMTDKRIHVAFEAIAKLLGHPVRFEIDNSLLPKFGPRLHDDSSRHSRRS